MLVACCTVGKKLVRVFFPLFSVLAQFPSSLLCTSIIKYFLFYCRGKSTDKQQDEWTENRRSEKETWKTLEAIKQICQTFARAAINKLNGGKGERKNPWFSRKLVKTTINTNRIIFNFKVQRQFGVYKCVPTVDNKRQMKKNIFFVVRWKIVFLYILLYIDSNRRTQQNRSMPSHLLSVFEKKCFQL